MRFILTKKVDYRLYAVQSDVVAQVYAYDDEAKIGYALDFVFHPELTNRAQEATETYRTSCAQS